MNSTPSPDAVALMRLRIATMSDSDLAQLLRAASIGLQIPESREAMTEVTGLSDGELDALEHRTLGDRFFHPEQPFSNWSLHVLAEATLGLKTYHLSEF